MRIFGTLSLLVVAAIGLYWYAASIKSASTAPVMSAEDKALIAPLVSPSALASPSPGVGRDGKPAWGHRPGINTAPHGQTKRDDPYKDDLDRAKQAADAMKQGRKDADDAGAF